MTRVCGFECRAQWTDSFFCSTFIKSVFSVRETSRNRKFIWFIFLEFSRIKYRHFSVARRNFPPCIALHRGGTFTTLIFLVETFEFPCRPRQLLIKYTKSLVFSIHSNPERFSCGLPFKADTCSDESFKELSSAVYFSFFIQLKLAKKYQKKLSERVQQWSLRIIKTI